MTGCGGAALVWGARAGAEDAGGLGGALVVSGRAACGAELAGEGAGVFESAAGAAVVVAWSLSRADDGNRDC